MLKKSTIASPKDGTTVKFEIADDHLMSTLRLDILSLSNPDEKTSKLNGISI